MVVPLPCLTLAPVDNLLVPAQEHETAMRFFNRATQVDANFTYAYTLAGHEYFANEDFQRSMEAFRAAIKLDPRHYNAWCSLSLRRPPCRRCARGVLGANNSLGSPLLAMATAGVATSLRSASECAALAAC